MDSDQSPLNRPHPGSERLHDGLVLRNLNKIVWITCIGLLLLSIQPLLTKNWVIFLLLISASVLQYLNLMLIEMNFSRLASRVFLYSMTAVVFFGIYINYGLSDPGFIVFPVILVVAGSLLGKVEFYGFVGIIVAYVCGLGLQSVEWVAAELFHTEFGYRTATSIIVIVISAAVSRIFSEAHFDAVGMLGQHNQKIHDYRSELSRASRPDNLTGLPGKKHISDRAEHLLSQRDKKPFTLMYLKLVDFSRINDSYGRSAEDIVLKSIATRLKNQVRITDVVCRLYGESFLVLIENTADVAVVSDIAMNIQAAVDAPVAFEQQELTISCCIGIASSPQDSIQFDDLLNHAELAARQASNEESGIFFYAFELQKKSRNYIEVVSALRNGLDEKQFILHYQPKINLEDGKLVGLEALIRWQHPEKGLIMPVSFLAAAERSGLMIEVGYWIIEQALKDAVIWHDQKGQWLPVSINLSSVQLREQDFSDRLIKGLFAHGVPVNAVMLDVRESMVVINSTVVRKNLADLAGQGFKISIDDFGAGYTSLGRLKELTVESLKLGPKTVQAVEDKTADESMLRAMVAMSESMGFYVQAAGVESAEVAEVLEKIGCKVGQGYHWAKPMPYHELQGFSEARSAERKAQAHNA